MGYNQNYPPKLGWNYFDQGHEKGYWLLLGDINFSKLAKAELVRSEIIQSTFIFIGQKIFYTDNFSGRFFDDSLDFFSMPRICTQFSKI